MNSWAVVGCLAAILLASGQNSPPSSSVQPPNNAERNESGQLLLPSGGTVSYRIRLLPLSSFPALPEAVADQLNRRGCMIPQTYEARQPENIIQGAFRAPGTSDWAALCSSEGKTTLYVFFAGRFDEPTALRSQSDTAWLGADPGEPIRGSAWGIATRPAQQLRSEPEFRRAFAIDHDAIDDAWLERSITVRYDQDGKWTSVRRGDDGDK